jgi:hypothetical protein
MGWFSRSSGAAAAPASGNVAKASEDPKKKMAGKEMLLKLKEIDIKKHEINKIKTNLDVLTRTYLGKTRNNKNITYETAEKNGKLVGLLSAIEGYKGNLRFAKSSNISSKGTLRLERASNALRTAGNKTRKAITNRATAASTALRGAVESTRSRLSAVRTNVGTAIQSTRSRLDTAATTFGEQLEATKIAASKSLMSMMPSAKAKQLLAELETAPPEKREGLKREIIAELDRLVDKRRMLGGISRNRAGDLRLKVTKYIQDLESGNANRAQNNIKKELKRNTGLYFPPKFVPSTSEVITPVAEATAENAAENATENAAPAIGTTGGGRRTRRYRKH